MPLLRCLSFHLFSNFSKSELKPQKGEEVARAETCLSARDSLKYNTGERLEPESLIVSMRENSGSIVRIIH